MKVASIIAEYMPFHNGHARHIALTRERGADIVVAIMDGHISQRGDISPLSRASRALAALKCGADIVVELPTLFACRTADAFARAGVETALALGSDMLSFGSESGDIEALTRPENDPDSVKEALARGESYPRALGASTAPNDILAREYLRALEGTGIEPLIIQRNSPYHAEAMGRFASASAIRGAVTKGDNADEAVPEEARFQLEQMEFNETYDLMRLAALRSLATEGRKKLPDVNEGLENLMSEAAKRPTLAGALGYAKCKRYTYSRLNRLCAHALIGLTGELAKRHPRIEYLRLTGYRDNGALDAVAGRMKMPFSRAGELKGNEIFALENRATDLWALTRAREEERAGGQEYLSKVIKL